MPTWCWPGADSTVALHVFVVTPMQLFAMQPALCSASEDYSDGARGAWVLVREKETGLISAITGCARCSATNIDRQHGCLRRWCG